MTAAAEKTRISVVAFEGLAFAIVGCFGLDDGAVALAIGAEGSAAETLAARGAGSCGSADFALTFSGAAVTV